MKKKKSDKIKIEFEKEHLYVLVSALETYSRPKGSCSKFVKKGDDWCIIVEEPYIT